MPFRKAYFRKDPDRSAPAPTLRPNTPTAYVDGGSRGNPGPAGFGVLIKDEAGNKVGTISRFVGRQTNNFAEYSGLIAALEFALEKGFRSLQVFSDSELMVRQILGVYKVRNENIRPLYERARDLIRQLEWFGIQHVRRELNREADGLANRAMDQAAADKINNK